MVEQTEFAPSRWTVPALLFVLAGALALLALITTRLPASVGPERIAGYARAGEVAKVVALDDDLVVHLRDGRQLRTPRGGMAVAEALQAWGLTEQQAATVIVEQLPAGARLPTPLPGTVWLLPAGVAVVASYALRRSLGAAQVKEIATGEGETLRRTATAQSYLVSHPTTTFADVAGVPEAVEELRELVAFLREPERFAALGARVPRGVLLSGPPGTGKTLLARAVAGEAKVPFFRISGAEFVEMYVGVGASRVRKLFGQARRSAPCIVFIDEIDAIGRRRQSGAIGVNEEREQTLNQILVEMDGFDDRSTVIVLAATNRPDVLDPALLRPGRFDRRVSVDPPDRAGRETILRVHTRDKPLAADVDLGRLATLTAGFTGADLANLANEAAILAALRGKQAIGMAEIEAAMERVIAGPERKGQLLGEEERRIVAYHEAGHALVARALHKGRVVQKVSIVARGASGGHTQIVPDEERHLWSRSQLQSVLAYMLGGRAAEEVRFGEATTGAENDLQQATGLARRMIVRLGMSDRLGPVAIDALEAEQWGGLSVGASIARDVCEEVSQLLREAHERASDVLRRGATCLDAVAEALLERETLTHDEFEAVCRAAAAAAA